jgi:hypothetical protein
MQQRAERQDRDAFVPGLMHLPLPKGKPSRAGGNRRAHTGTTR